jgi:hypothetical protein
MIANSHFMLESNFNTPGGWTMTDYLQSLFATNKSKDYNLLPYSPE